MMIVAAVQAFVLFAPLLVAAAFSGVVLRLNLLSWLRLPIDAGATFRGRRLFGETKTWRGVVVAVVGAIAAVTLERPLTTLMPRELLVVDYENANPAWLGGAMGLGAMLGELPNSFVKRRLGISASGTTTGWLALVFYVWDQVDLLTGAWPLLLFWVRPSATLVATSFGMVLAIHPLVALIGYIIGARKTAR